MFTRAKPDPIGRPRRFWTRAEAAAAEHGFDILLDGRPAKTPAGAPLRLARRALAQAIAAEWDGAGQEVIFADMPLTRLAFTAIDRAETAREGLAEELARFGGRDVLCHRAGAPAVLVAAESRTWDPWLQWGERALGVRLERRLDLDATPQPVASLERLKALGRQADRFDLTGLAFAAGLYGSAILAFAVARGALSGADAFDASRIEERHQESQWGEDPEAAARTARLRLEAQALDLWFSAQTRD